MKEYAKSFYKGKTWQKISKLYMTSQNYICERCGSVGEICHHKKYITPQNINDLNITLNIDNLECLCKNCHNKEHISKRSRVIFDNKGNIEKVKECSQLFEYKQAVKKINELKSKFIKE